MNMCSQKENSLWTETDFQKVILFSVTFGFNRIMFFPVYD